MSSKRDPTEGIPGYRWNCCNCSASKPWLVMTLRCVKWFINPAQALASQPKKATVYCASCPPAKRLYCTACAGKLHSVSTVTQHHSLEAINPYSCAGVFFIGPIFDFLFLPMIFLFFVLLPGIPTDYLTGRDICPVVHTVRSNLYHIDSGVIYYFKDKFAWACNLEDCYFRLIIDTWVRAISTDSDNLLLLASTMLRSSLFHIVAIRYLVLPTLVLINVVFSVVAHFVLKATSHFFPGHVFIPPRIQNLQFVFNEKLQSWIDYAALDLVKFPPSTTPRERPRTDYTDSFKYWYDRETRVFNYYREAATNRLKMLAVGVPLTCVVIRVLCIFTPLAHYLRILMLMPGDVTARAADVPIDALGHTIDKVGRAAIARFIPLGLTHIPYAFLICAALLHCIIWYPYFKWWLDTRNWYGGQCGKAPMTEFSSRVRWFPKTFEPVN